MKRLLIVVSLLSFSLAVRSQDPIDDKALEKHMETEGQKVIADPTTVVPEELFKGLSSKSADFTIPPTFQLCKSTNEIYDKVKKGSLIICSYYLCGQCSIHHPNAAGGFMISSTGLAVTNHHVIAQENSTGIVAFTSDGKPHRIKKVLAADPVSDVAVIQLEGDGFSYLPIAESTTIGARVWALSHPRGYYYTLSSGIASRYGKDGEATWLEITADCSVGSSGSPIVNDDGQVVGVASRTGGLLADPEDAKTLQMVKKFCTPSSAIRNLKSKS